MAILEHKKNDNAQYILVSLFSALAMLISAIMPSEALSQTWDCGVVADTVSCTLDDDGTFTVSGTGEMKDYEYDWYGDDSAPSSGAPWGQSREAMAKIKKIEVEDTVTRIGNGAFTGATMLLSVSMDGVISVGEQAFRDSYRLQELSMPKVESLEKSSFEWNANLKSVYAPNLDEVGKTAFGYTYKLEYTEFADNVIFDNLSFVGSKLSGCNSSLCFDCGDKYLQQKKGCVDNCPNTHKLSDGICYRVRYTPAEAAEVAGETNTIFLYYK